MKILEKGTIFGLILSFFLFLNIFIAQAGYVPDLKVHNNDLGLSKRFNFVDDDFTGSLRFKVINFVNPSGLSEKRFVLSYGRTDRPMIKIFNYQGQLVKEWQPFAWGFVGDISLAVADLDNDGSDEIIAGAGRGGGPQIIIFDQNGQQEYDFFWATEQGYRQGVEVAAGDINGNGEKEIIVSYLQEGEQTIKFFNVFGEKVADSLMVEGSDNFEPVRVGLLDLGNDKVEEILVGFSSGSVPKIKIYRLDGSVINEFLLYHESFKGGVNFVAKSFDHENLIVSGSGFSGGPHVRFFNGFGYLKKDPAFFVYDKDFRGGLEVDVVDLNDDGKMEFIFLPQTLGLGEPNFWHKHIAIDLSEQQLKYYQNNKLVESYSVSSGRRGMETPIGEFRLLAKNQRAYSAKYDLYMPWWMSFKKGYGIHELPEWANGYKEGQNHLGWPVSHGCVRLGVGNAENLYHWSPVGTPVVIKR
ncbi:MAG TPA: L,D-transpeptidase [Patescibacteria group bacterium]|nr:L,D-transpeptidase [Patescibacteria group bacterium]